jgi:hypothetical protein
LEESCMSGESHDGADIGMASGAMQEFSDESAHETQESEAGLLVGRKARQYENFQHYFTVMFN